MAVAFVCSTKVDPVSSGDRWRGWSGELCDRFSPRKRERERELALERVSG